MPVSRRVCSNNKYLGQIDVNHISPPHNARSIKRCIASHEGIVDYRSIALFDALSSKSPIGDDDHVPILASTGPGSMLQEPMALVVVDASDLVNANNSIINANNSIKDGTYFIINSNEGYVWWAEDQNVYIFQDTLDNVRSDPDCEVSLPSYQSLSYACSPI
jgi:hypothetical protein